MRLLLETERLILRRFTAADVDHLFALDNDPEGCVISTAARRRPVRLSLTKFCRGSSSTMNAGPLLAFGPPPRRLPGSFWDGDDVEYALEKSDWEQSKFAGGR